MSLKKLIKILVIPTLCISVVACSNKSDKSSSSEDKTTLKQKSAQASPHQDKRLAFEKIKIASASNEFKGGSTLEDLKSLYGEPNKHDKKPAGNVELDSYTWTFDHVTITINMFQNSTIVKSISNFAFNRDLNISQKDYNKLKKGMTYNQVTKLLTEPDDYTMATSSAKDQTQAIWISGLKSKVRGANISLLFENDKLVDMSQKGLIE
ncbi:DUF3862 domain-containing protein [Streptococcus hongkongensis]|nr:lipoprotein [Streptococcus uberis]